MRKIRFEVIDDVWFKSGFTILTILFNKLEFDK